MTTTAPATVPMIDDPVTTDVRSTVRRLLTAECSSQDLLTFVAGDRDYNDALWRRLGRDLGLTALLVPEEWGGAGASTREAAAVLTELGRAAAPVPYLSSAVLATTALIEAAVLPSAGVPAARAALDTLLDGGIGVLAVPATQAPRDPCTPTAATTSTSDGRVRVSGTVTHVLGAADAGTILVPADHDGRTALILVAADTDGVTVRRRTSIDLTRPTSDMRFDAVYGEILAHGDDASRILRSSLETAAALLAAEQVGLCEWALDTSVDYLKARYQFGQPIGSNQALRHRTAQLWIDVNHARAAAVYAASTRASGSDDAATALAQAHCSETALHLVESAIQIHGGVGFAWEHPLHLYLKRAFADSVLLGDSQTHRRALAGFIDIAAPHAESSR